MIQCRDSESGRRPGFTSNLSSQATFKFARAAAGPGDAQLQVVSAYGFGVLLVRYYVTAVRRARLVPPAGRGTACVIHHPSQCRLELAAAQATPGPGPRPGPASPGPAARHRDGSTRISLSTAGTSLNRGTPASPPVKSCHGPTVRTVTVTVGQLVAEYHRRHQQTEQIIPNYSIILTI